jgi:hypothetical protein
MDPLWVELMLATKYSFLACRHRPLVLVLHGLCTK